MDVFTVNDEKIVKVWMDHAIQSGDLDAYYNIGLFYLYGQGVDFDIEEARKWFEKAASGGHMEGANNLAVIYAGDGNYQEAAKWFRQAAQMGDEKAARNLAKCLQLNDKS